MRISRNFQMDSLNRNIVPIGMALLLLLSLVGCGGSPGGTASSGNNTGGNRVATGRARFSVVWPKPEGRLIPVASKSIRVVLRNNTGSQIAPLKLLVRPTDGSNTSTVEWSDLPVGFLTATSDALPNADGTGVVQASATAGVEIRSKETSEVRLTMNSTIHAVRLSPASLGFPMEQGPQPLTATAYNEQEEVVLTAESKWQWSIAPAGIATLSATSGANITVQGVKAGTATITVTELESGKSATAPVEVRQGSRPEDGSGLADSPWPKFRGNVGNNAIAPNGTQGTLRWKVQLTPNPQPGKGYAAAINGDGSIVTVNRDYRLTVLESDTGTLRWRFDETITRSAPACGKDGTIYFVGEGRFLYALNGQNGAVRWKTELINPNLPTSDSDLFGSPTIGSDGRIYVVLSRKLFIVDSLTGVKVGESTEGELHTVCPAMDTQGHLYIPGFQGFFYAYYADGTVKWKSTFASDSSDATLGPDGNILVSSTGSGTDGFTKESLILLNASDGSILWQVDSTTERFSLPIVGPNGYVYVITMPLVSDPVPRKLVALNYATQERVWSIDLSPERTDPGWVVVNGKNEVFAPYFDGGSHGICGVNGANGAILWRAKVGDATSLSCAFDSTGVLYTASGPFTGDFLAVR